MAEQPPGDDMKRAITPRGYRFVVLWTLCVLLVYVVAGALGVRVLRRAKAEAEASRRAFLESAAAQATTKGPEPILRDGRAEVTVGLYVNRIVQLSTTESAWTADCDVWFRWSEDRLHPGDTFRIVNGEILEREGIESHGGAGAHYERLRLKVHLTKFFDATRFPFGDEALVVQVEDSGLGVDMVRYVPDERDSGVNFSGAPQLTITKSVAVEYRVEPERGGTHLGPSGARAHSYFVFAMIASAPGLALYLKMFQALFGSVSIAFISFLIKPTVADPRFGLGIGAAFASIANNVVVAGYFPIVRRTGLTTMINATGLGTIAIILVESAASLYILDTLGQERLYKLLDRVTLVTLLSGYVTLNVLWPVVAQP